MAPWFNTRSQRLSVPKEIGCLCNSNSKLVICSKGSRSPQQQLDPRRWINLWLKVNLKETVWPLRKTPSTSIHLSTTIRGRVRVAQLNLDLPHSNSSSYHLRYRPFRCSKRLLMPSRKGEAWFKAAKACHRLSSQHFSTSKNELPQEQEQQALKMRTCLTRLDLGALRLAGWALMPLILGPNISSNCQVQVISILNKYIRRC